MEAGWGQVLPRASFPGIAGFSYTAHCAHGARPDPSWFSWLPDSCYSSYSKMQGADVSAHVALRVKALPQFNRWKEITCSPDSTLRQILVLTAPCPSWRSTFIRPAWKCR